MKDMKVLLACMAILCITNTIYAADCICTGKCHCSGGLTITVTEEVVSVIECRFASVCGTLCGTFGQDTVAGMEGSCSGDTSTTVPTTTTISDENQCPAKQVLEEDNPNLENLRNFRDSKLANSTIGQKVIQIYYNNSGSINAALERSPVLKAVARRGLEMIAPIVGRKEE